MVKIYNQFIEHLAVLRQAGIRGTRVTFSEAGFDQARLECTSDTSQFYESAHERYYAGVLYTVERGQASPILVHP